VRGVSIIGDGHGNAIQNANSVADEFCQGKVNPRIEEDLVLAT